MVEERAAQVIDAIEVEIGALEEMRTLRADAARVEVRLNLILKLEAMREPRATMK